jgi:hypothetical protein
MNGLEDALDIIGRSGDISYGPFIRLASDAS